MKKDFKNPVRHASTPEKTKPKQDLASKIRMLSSSSSRAPRSVRPPHYVLGRKSLVCLGFGIVFVPVDVNLHSVGCSKGRRGGGEEEGERRRGTFSGLVGKILV